MAVNISSYSINEDLVDNHQRNFKEDKLKPCYLELEITESIMQTPEITIPILNKIKELGVHLSIDDFGTGYSSLAYLRDFPIDSPENRSIFYGRDSNGQPKWSHY